ncbi:unnamed protein product [Adineta steineri]|uniref:Uncharacterized protein n=1 Tax=Adineta steineri TaxID=433720 RepID=A0A813QB27_9BILA|nr:unnamed protein product [Adineta steineri]CAF1031403.1 unnamed protein product [Adineta steineri]
MAAPIAVVAIYVYNIISFIQWGKNIIQKIFSKETTTTTIASVFPSSRIIIEDTTSIFSRDKIFVHNYIEFFSFQLKLEFDYENLKQKKQYKSNDRTASSTSGSSISFVLIIAIILAVVAFIIYRKRIETNENKLSFEQTEKYFETSPSPPTSETEPNHSSMWSTIPSSLHRSTLTIV